MEWQDREEIADRARGDGQLTGSVHRAGSRNRGPCPELLWKQQSAKKGSRISSEGSSTNGRLCDPGEAIELEGVSVASSLKWVYQRC